MEVALAQKEIDIFGVRSEYDECQGMPKSQKNFKIWCSCAPNTEASRSNLLDKINLFSIYSYPRLHVTKFQQLFQIMIYA
jgi:hypothetical protein